MKRFWEIVKRFFSPGPWVIPLVILSAVGLLLTASPQYQSTPLAYMAYAVSSYTLIAVCLDAVSVGKRTWRWMNQNPFMRRILTDDYFRVRIGMVASLFINLCYCLFRLICAVLYLSFWDTALVIYYTLLCGIRLFMIRRLPTSIEQTNYRRELSSYSTTAWFLLVLNLALMPICTQIVRDGRSYAYPGTLIYVVALHAFYSLILAIFHVGKDRKFTSPVLSAAKAVNLTTALVSFFSLEVAMTAKFSEDPQFRIFMTAATAFAVCILAFSHALFMLVYATWKQKKISKC